MTSRARRRKTRKARKQTAYQKEHRRKFGVNPKPERKAPAEAPATSVYVAHEKVQPTSGPKFFGNWPF